MRSMLWRSIALLALSPVASGLATAQTLFVDLNPNAAAPPSSSPEAFTDANGQVWFRASDALGSEPWVSDGTIAGTRRVKDIAVGVGSSVPDEFTLLPNGKVLFSASGASGRELWTSDGTSNGTQLLADIVAGPASSHPTGLVSFGPHVYFHVTNPQGGRDLWRTDGTSAGTQLVVNLFGSTLSPFVPISDLVVAGNRLFFGVNLTGVGTVLMKSDGTAAGTLVVSALNNDPFGKIEELFDLNGLLLFRAKHPTLGVELWRSDGTATGTVVVKDIAPNGDANPKNLVQLGNDVLFTATDPLFGIELFRTDGTDVGTDLVADIAVGTNPFNTSSDPIPLGVIGANLLFNAYTIDGGRELYVTDGSPLGTMLIADLWPGSSWSNPTGAAILNGELFFAANDGQTGTELWASDGTPAGTRLVKDIVAGFDNLGLGGFTTSGTRVFFAANDATHGVELFATDGTSIGTDLVLDLWETPVSADSDPHELVASIDEIFFAARPTPNGEALFVSDGTVAGTQTILDPSNPFGIDSYVGLTPIAHGLFFFGAEPTGTLSPFFTDGTLAGTVKLPGTFGGFLPSIEVIGDRLFFLAFDAVNFEQNLFVSDGTAAGTIALSSSGLAGTSLAAVDDKVLFIGDVPLIGNELFVSDGTPTGTAPIFDINPGPTSSDIFNFASAQSRAYFVANDGVHGHELWVSDATPGGTHLVADLAPGTASLNIGKLVPFGDRVVFESNDIFGHDIWVSDGTAGGTQVVLPLAPGDTLLPGMTAGRDALLFTVTSASGDSQVWRTDGTVGGTSVVPLPGSPAFQPFFAAVGTDGEILLALDGLVTGNELYHTQDGLAPPSLVADIAPGLVGSAPSAIVRLADRLFIVADDGVHGTELHVVPLLNAGAFVAESYGEGCAGPSATTPQLQAVDDAVVGTLFQIVASALPTNAATLVVVGAEPANLPFSPTCSLLVAPPLLTFSLMSNGSGVVTLPVLLAPSTAGLRAYVQILAAATSGATVATPGLELVIGD